ncbi:thiosulfate oxidation carrier protein SoxY [Pollutimonas bauzanensis]|uniref:Sulfur-oxidizing protein SoxY n=1 Tax=Pollutimonas bauzanensis TaxID=658167 RepID=A0A1M5MUP0_9BURK|nr:thiosulfate oxidation carrier protein SoxY [Pollutimonas bauzanensis]SHG80862.1 sulfur-oxidizing protein SoxY [Pollutimonas bauzanensis]
MTEPDKAYFMTRRAVLRFALAGASGALLASPPARAQTWRQVAAVRNHIGDATVLTGGLLIGLPLVAEDGSAVPLEIKSDKRLIAAPIRHLEIFAPRNPTPEVAAFDFGPEVATLNIATRIRLSESQTVIVVAHGSDGRIFIAEREVRVTTSGCIAPAQSDRSEEMKARVRMPRSWQAGASGEVLTMISHPMATGLAKDAQGNTPPQRIIETFEATLDGRPLVKARYHRSLAVNPYLRFDVAPQRGGDMRFKWTEDTGRSTEHKEIVRLD